MISKDLKKLLRQHRIGGTFGRGIRLFDSDFITNMPVSTMDDMVQRAREYIDPRVSYRKFVSDCDNYSLFYHALVSLEWASNSNNIFPLAFGRAHQPGHDFNIGICKEGIFVWNYGVLTDWDLSKIDEIEFK